MPKTQTPLQTARLYEKEQGRKIPAADRPLFHLTPMTGWMNDPNGFCFYNGEYHLFYQYYPYNTIWGPMHWGHAKSADLLHWTYLPCALAPDTAADAAGCFSGSAVPMEDGRLLLMYTGVQRATTESKELQAQCVALGDGVNFEKPADNPVIDAADLPAGYSAHDFRDPKAWREDGKYYCVAANRHEQRQGSVLLFESADGLAWRYLTELDASDGLHGKMWECPDFFPLDGRQVLLVSPQEMQATADGEFHAGYGTMALLGRYDAATHAFTRQSIQPVDYGLDFYAPQTTLAPDGRRILVAWMENWETCNGAPRQHQWFGRMTLPRELSIRHGRLYQNPVRELQTLWKTDSRRAGITVNGETRFPELHGRALDMTVTLDLAASRDCKKFSIRFAQDDRLFTEIRLLPMQNELVFDRSRGGTRRDIPHTRHVKAAPVGGRLRLRLILDKECVELYINDGERVLASVIRTPLAADGITLLADGPAKLDLETHQLA